MTLQDHLKATRRTWNDQGTVKNVAHLTLGIQSEIGELADQFKKNIGYNKELNVINIKEELGDMLFFIHRGIDELELPARKIHKKFLEEKKEDIKELDVNNYPETIAVLSYVTVAFQQAVSADELDAMCNALGELLVIIEHIGKHFNLTMEEIAAKNIAKLYVRYPDKFADDKAMIRDIEAEIKVLSE
jgi:NTP pyrophosphatase (non-canonical NTP hydrolase)